MGCSECKDCAYGSKFEEEPYPFDNDDKSCDGVPNKKALVRVALVGSANVGKSVIFNHMTGKSQKIGNWAGKTVDLARGSLNFGGQIFELVDLPGIYSLSGQTEDEAVTFEYLASGEIDFVLNILDASSLERNLYVTLQVLEMGLPVVVVLNKIDIALAKGIKIDTAVLSEWLGIPVLEAVGTTGQGLTEIMTMVRRAACRDEAPETEQLAYSDDVENRVNKLTDIIGEPISGYPARFLAMKLLEGHEHSAKLVASRNSEILDIASAFQDELNEIYSSDSTEIITSERYALAHRIAEETITESSSIKPGFTEKLDKITTHPVAGYVILAMVMTFSFYLIFTVGTVVSGFMMQIYDIGDQYAQNSLGDGWAYIIIWNGIAQGFIAAVAFVLPFILPFYIFLALLEDSGYLARVAVLMDSTMHSFGLHGKAFIPLVLGYGCSVPAVLGTRILETRRERIITGFLTTIIPCAARTVVIMALVGVFLGWYWALGFYILNLLVVFILGRAATKLIPGETYGMIMEIPRYHLPKAKLVLKQTWRRLRDFIIMALPILVFGSVLMVVLESSNISDPINLLLSPLTVWILGLPVAVGLILVLGVFRKELTMIMLISLVNVLNYDSVTDYMTMGQIVVFTLFVMFYIPCISTLAAMLKEYGAAITAKIAVAQTLLAMLIAGGANLFIMYYVGA